MIKFYLISTAISIIIIFITVMAFQSKLRREGYKSQKQSVWESIHAVIHLLIPIWNIIIALFSLFAFDKVYESAKAKCVKEDTQ